MGQSVSPDFLQDEQEFAAFTEILQSENVTSYLEIGSKFGGSLRRVGANLRPPARVVAVDLPNHTEGWRQSSAALYAVVDELRTQGHDAMVIWGDSTDPVVVEEVRRQGPFDAVFIDANHTLPYVTKDWENYGPMARIVAFHDISWRREKWTGSGIDVPKLWHRIKGNYRHREIRFCPTGRNNGIGVLWMR